MYKQLPMYQRIGKAAYKVDLSNTILLANHLNNPHKKIKTIHIAGTNGKGSTSHMLASVLQEAGYKTGLYTSPHLKDYRERIKINGKPISKNYVSNFITEHKPFFEEHKLSFFEMTVGLACSYFNDKKVDIAIIEVGLGGRLDSTNIITPEVSVITNIGLDHTQFLGNTLSQIATEKGGIIKPKVPVVIGETTPETLPIFKEIALKNKTEIYLTEEISTPKIKTDLLGKYQNQNSKTTFVTLKILKKLGWKISEKDVLKGLQNIVKNTGLMGRWQLLQLKPKVICDTAHNTHGLKPVLEQLQSEKYTNLHIVLGVVNDKNLDQILPLFPRKATYYFCSPKIDRGLNPIDLKNKALKFNLIGEEYTSVQKAYKEALKNASQEDVIFIGGSTFVVAEVV
jgi:dihydrofolate synthase/folylpolyglutamate synthase